VPGLAKTQLPAEDRMAIHDLVARYNRFIDAGPERAWADEWVDTFTDDATFDCALGVYHGREELYRCREYLYTAEENRDYLGGQHWLHNIVLTPADDGLVDLWASFLLFMPGKPTPFVSLIGYYTDRVARVGDEWKFASRKVNLTL
jgi:hypothetical protein